MQKIFFTWPEGKRGAVTTSWDDGAKEDRPLVELFNRYGVKGTFNLNSSLVQNGGPGERIAASELKTLFAGHEVAVHGVTHPFLDRLSDSLALAEVLEDRRYLEQQMGRPICGMAYPYGSHDERIFDVLKQAGIVHSRTCANNPRFTLPVNYLAWASSCHQRAWQEAWPRFLEEKRHDKLFYLWGHSWEFDRDDNWPHIEEWCAAASSDGDFWHATNMEIYRYHQAWLNLQFSLDASSVENNSAVTVYFYKGDELCAIAPGDVVDCSK